MSLNPFLAHFADAPALVAQTQQSRFEACLNMAAAEMDRLAPQMSAFDDECEFWGEPGSFLTRVRPYVVIDGILQIPVKGVLLNNFPYALGSWATGYDYIWRAFQRGMGDFQVRGIALVCDTPGGQVAGCFDCVDRMWALKQQVGKPVRGYASEGAYSAGYAIISLCDTITVSRTGGVGSVGVVTCHADFSAMNERMGVKITYIFAGKHKVDGNSDEPLSPDAKARIEARIYETYGVFVSTVARNRPALSEDDARNSEALCFTATEALSNKFADNIGALDDALADYAADLSSDEDEEGDDDMSTTDTSAADLVAATDAARAEGHTAGLAEGTTQGAAQGVASERARIAAILDSDVAKTRPAAARVMAFDTDMSAEAVAVSLAKMPAEAVGVATSAFAAAMELGNPNLGAGGLGAQGGEADTQASGVLTIVRAAGMQGFKPAPSN